MENFWIKVIYFISFDPFKWNQNEWDIRNVRQKSNRLFDYKNHILYINI